VPQELPGSVELAELADLRGKDDIDPELAALPAPNRRERTFTIVLLAAAVVAALAMIFVLRRDVVYAVGGASVPADLGDLRIASDAALLARDNGFVRATGLLGASGGIRYERPLQEDTFRALPAAGRGEGAQVWVEVRVPAGQESGRWEPPRSFVGRLVRFQAAGPRHRGLARAIEEAGGSPVSAGAFLLVDEEEPARLRWAALLALVFLGLAVGNGVAIVRLLRRVT
jgi:hypothetical protein